MWRTNVTIPSRSASDYRSMMDYSSRTRPQRGFTLLEMLVVVMIIGILAGVVVVSVQAIFDRSHESACNLERRTIMTAIQSAKAGPDPDNESYNDYLENPNFPQYFERDGGTDQDPLWKGTAKHPGNASGCKYTIP